MRASPLARAHPRRRLPRNPLRVVGDAITVGLCWLALQRGAGNTPGARA
jgi:hypothetical protein